MQRRLNPGAALRFDFKGDTFPDGRWSWRPPITSVSKPWRVTYRTRNRSATLVCVETRAVPSTPRRIREDKRRTGILSHTRGALLIVVYESERPRDCCWLFLFEICDARLTKIRSRGGYAVWTSRKSVKSDMQSVKCEHTNKHTVLFYYSAPKYTQLLTTRYNENTLG